MNVFQDELWDEITKTLNSTGCGPQKMSKEWAKVKKF